MAKKKLPKKSPKKAVKSARRPARPAARKAKARAKARTKVTAKAKAVRKPLKTKKAARPAAKKAPRKVAKKAARKVVKKVVKKAVRKVAPKPVRKAVAKPVRKVAAKPVRKAAPRKAAPRKAAVPPPPVRLQRERRRLPEVESEGFTGTGGGDSRLLSSAKAGHDEMRTELRQHTESSPELTAGDVDAKWQDAYAVGDEAPGGDNMTPDQDRVDDIGKALGIEYDDDEELQGGAELTARDESRWELDPDSKDEDEGE